MFDIYILPSTKTEKQIKRVFDSAFNRLKHIWQNTKNDNFNTLIFDGNVYFQHYDKKITENFEQYRNKIIEYFSNEGYCVLSKSNIKVIDALTHTQTDGKVAQQFIRLIKKTLLKEKT